MRVPVREASDASVVCVYLVFRGFGFAVAETLRLLTGACAVLVNRETEPSLTLKRVQARAATK